MDQTEACRLADEIFIERKQPTPDELRDLAQFIRDEHDTRHTDRIFELEIALAEQSGSHRQELELEREIVSNFQEETAALKGKIDELEARIKELESQVEELEGHVCDLETAGVGVGEGALHGGV